MEASCTLEKESFYFDSDISGSHTLIHTLFVKQRYL